MYTQEGIAVATSFSTDTQAAAQQLKQASITAPRFRAVLATVIGNALEWFDFAAYAFLAALIGKHFFPSGNEAVTLLSSFAVFGVGYYVFLIYLPSFLPKYAGVSASSALWVSTGGLATMMFSIPAWGLLSDRIGRKPPLLAAAVICIFAPYPIFTLLVDAPSLAQVYLVSIGSGALVGVFAGIGPALMSEMFPTSQRTTGVAVSFGLATAILGGFAPFLSTWLIGATGSPIAPTFYVIAAALVSTASILTLRETAHARLG